jgi:hypothetical protein
VTATGLQQTMAESPRGPDEPAMLPEEFSDLECLAKEWSLPSERGRYDKRLSSSMEEIEAFYRAIAPRAADALAYLDRLDLNDLPDEALNLMRMLYALSTVSFAVDCFKQQRIPDSGSAYLDVIEEPYP